MRPLDKTRTAAEALVDQLIVNGVGHVFCVPGESYLAVLDAFHDRALEVTVCRQEGGAAMMAEAVGKATGRPGICFVTRGPGATNASAGIHIAQQDSTPMIMFVGLVTRDVKDREALQELDLRAVFGSMTKWTAEIDDPARVPEIVSRAFYTATSGRPGPVVLGLPEDMLTERTAAPNAPAFEPVETFPGAPEMNRLAELLAQAERPLAVLGGSRWSAEACAAVTRFAEHFALPVATSYRRLPLSDPLHACHAGDQRLITAVIFMCSPRKSAQTRVDRGPPRKLRPIVGQALPCQLISYIPGLLGVEFAFRGLAAIAVRMSF